VEALEVARNLESSSAIGSRMDGTSPDARAGRAVTPKAGTAWDVARDHQSITKTADHGT